MSSKRTFKRNVAKERKRIASIIAAASSSQATQETPNSFTPTSFTAEDEIYENFTMESPQPLRAQLRKWFVDHSPTVQCCNSLLKVLKSQNLDVPTSVIGLIQQNDKCVMRTVAPGNYMHIGLLRQLQKAKEVLLQHEEVLELDIGIDGLPLYKSSAVGLWPILGTNIFYLPTFS